MVYTSRRYTTREDAEEKKKREWDREWRRFRRLIGVTFDYTHEPWTN